MGRRSILDMIQVTRRTAIRGMDSRMNDALTDISDFGAFGACGLILWAMRLVAKRRAAKRPMKMSSPQPARSPSLPMKILWRGGGGTGALGSVGISVGSGFSAGSEFNGPPRASQIDLGSPPSNASRHRCDCVRWG